MLAHRTGASLRPMDDGALVRDVTEQVARSLERAALFSDLDAATRASVAAKLTHIALPGGSALFRAGDTADALYLILSGRLAVRTPDTASAQHVAELGADDIVGELSLIGQRRRAHDVIALRDSELLRLDRFEFDRLLHEHPEALDGLMYTIVERLGAPPREAPRRPHTLAILPRGHDPQAMAPILDRFVSGLAQALQSHGARVRMLGPAELSRPTGWFSQVEAQSDYVLYRAIAPDDAWAQLCLRQADDIIEVAWLAQDAVASPVGLGAAGPDGVTLPRRRDLVLLRDGTAPPAAGSTAPWLALAGDTPHHHASLDVASDFHRLARMFTGRAVGIVMAGGGARGFAHIGAVRALREAGVPLDLLGGASMGAIVAAGVAAGWTDQELHDRFKRAFVSSNPLSDYTVPFVSLFAGSGVSQRLRDAFGDLALEDLPHDFFCVCANLTTSKAELYRRGSLVRRLRASVAIPGVLPPVFEKGQVLVDGGVIENFPVQSMRMQMRGPVIGIDIETGGALAAGADVLEPWSAWEFVRRLLWRRGETLPFPTIVRILLRSALVASSYRASEQRKACDLLILPPMTDVDLLDWSSFERGIDIGYRAAQSALEQIRDTPLAARLMWPV